MDRKIFLISTFLLLGIFSYIAYAGCPANEFTCGMTCAFTGASYDSCFSSYGTDFPRWQSDPLCLAGIQQFTGDCFFDTDCCSDQYCDYWGARCFPNLLAGACRLRGCSNHTTAPSGNLYCQYISNHNCVQQTVPSGYECCAKTCMAGCQGSIDCSELIHTTGYGANDPNNCGGCGLKCLPNIPCVDGTCKSSGTTTTIPSQSCQQYCSGYTGFGCTSSPSTACNGYLGSCNNNYCRYACTVSTSTGFSECSPGQYCFCYNTAPCPNCNAQSCTAAAGPNSQCLPTCQNYCNSLGAASFDCNAETDACYNSNTLSNWVPYSGVTQCPTCWCLFRRNCPIGCSGGQCVGATTTTIGGTTTTTTSGGGTTTTWVIGTTTTVRTTTTSTTRTTMVPNCLADGACDQPGQTCCAGGKLYKCTRMS